MLREHTCVLDVNEVYKNDRNYVVDFICHKYKVSDKPMVFAALMKALDDDFASFKADTTKIGIEISADRSEIYIGVM